MNDGGIQDTVQMQQGGVCRGDLAVIWNSEKGTRKQSYVDGRRYTEWEVGCSERTVGKRRWRVGKA